jgi:hypothetical protein
MVPIFIISSEHCTEAINAPKINVGQTWFVFDRASSM